MTDAGSLLVAVRLLASCVCDSGGLLLLSSLQCDTGQSGVGGGDQYRTDITVTVETLAW